MMPAAVPILRGLITLINRHQCRNFLRVSTLVWLLGVIGAALMPQSIEAQGSRNNGGAEAQFTAEGTERCLRCHAGERMTIMADTAHGNPDNPDAPYASHGCESCHGPGSLHVSRARGGRGFPALVTFAESDSVQRQTEACIGCHANDMGDLEGMEWSGSVHDADDMTCVSCHEAHIVGNPLEVHERQLEACATCHKEEIASHSRFEDKGIVFDRLSCYDCHDVHQLIHEP
jgi:DmsE family decaheme c-type cytochrome